MRPHTSAQLAVLCRIQRGIVDWRELQAACGFRSTNAIREHLEALRRKGYVDWPRGTRHTLRLRAAPIIEERDGVQQIVAFTKPGEM